MDPATTLVARLAPAGRDLGVDTARGLALFTMMATHIMPLATAAGTVAFAGHFAGRASALFAVLAGFSIVLATRSAAGRTAAAAASLVVRGVMIFCIGLLLGQLTTHLAIILTVYGLLFAAAPVLLRAPTWLLGVLAPVWLAASPVLSFLVRRATGARPDPAVPDVTSLGDPARLLDAVVLTGYYPALQWFGFIVLGMFLARLPAPDPHGDAGAAGRRLPPGLVVWAGLAAGGAIVAVAARLVSSAFLAAGGRAALDRLLAGDPRTLDEILVEGNFGLTPTDSWWWLAIAAPHSGTPFDMLHVAGAAVAALALCRLLAGWLGRPRPGGGARPAEIASGRRGHARLLALVPLSAPGSMPLSVYAGHTVLLEFTALAPIPDGAEWLLHCALFSGAAIAWKLSVSGRGPLEWLVGTASRGLPRPEGAQP